MYSFYCKLSLKSKSAELLIATERHELDRAALDKQLLSRERELIHCKEQLAKEKQVILRVARVVSVNTNENVCMQQVYLDHAVVTSTCVSVKQDVLSKQRVSYHN